MCVSVLYLFDIVCEKVHCDTGDNCKCGDSVRGEREGVQTQGHRDDLGHAPTQNRPHLPRNHMTIT